MIVLGWVWQLVFFRPVKAKQEPRAVEEEPKADR